jgi:peroxiredoxin
MEKMQPLLRRVFFLATLLAGLAWIFLSAAPESAATGGRIPEPRANFPAPDFTLETLDGQTVILSALEGQAVLINVWATWCPPCRAEMPAIQRAYDAYKDQGFAVLAVNSTIQDTFADIAPFVQKYELTFPILLDRDGSVTRAYRITSLPTSFFIGRDGIIREVVIGGPMAEALLRARIENLIKEP